MPICQIVIFAVFVPPMCIMFLDPGQRVQGAVILGIFVLLLVAYLVLGKLLNHDFRMLPHEVQRPLLSFFRPALSNAAAAGRPEEVERLLADGADVNIRRRASGCRDGSTALHDACSSTALKTLVGGHFEWGHDATVQLLLDQGAGVNVKRRDGITPMMIAAGLGRCAVVRQLLDANASVHLKAADGSTPLTSACEWGHCDATVKLLLDNGALTNFQTEFGDSPLHGAAGFGSLPIVQLLLDNGAEVNARTNAQSRVIHFGEAGDTPLHRAAGRPAVFDIIPGNSETVLQMLLANGADVHARNISGQTPEDLARLCLKGLSFSMLTRIAKREAFCMGQNLRLGAKSPLLGLDAGVVRMILEQACDITVTALDQNELWERFFEAGVGLMWVE